MYVSNPIRSDGFGAQFQTIIYSILVAEYENNEFVYTPIKAMEHNYTSDPLFLENMENLMNIKSSFPNKNDETLLHHYDIWHVIKTVESNIDFFLQTKTMNDIKQIFRANKNFSFGNNTKNVAVHIRRPNPHDNRVEGADTPIGYYISKMNEIRNRFPTTDLVFHIYSQGNTDEFQALSGNDVIYHIDENITDTFVGMVFADILVMSRSSFSYSAALLSDGIVYFQPFWCRQAKHWVI